MLNNTEELNAMISLSGNAVSNIDVFVATFQSTKRLLANQACRNSILLQYLRGWEMQLKSVKAHIIKGIHLEHECCSGLTSTSSLRSRLESIETESMASLKGLRQRYVLLMHGIAYHYTNMH